MTLGRNVLLRAAAAGLYSSGLYRLFRVPFGGIGSILLFHRVLPPEPAKSFAPNAFLSVSTDFFEAVIRTVQAEGYEIVTLSEARRRLVEDGARRRPFVCLTFDDGFRDNYEHAFQICRRYGIPMTVFVTTGFIDRQYPMWWMGLEEIIASEDSIAVSFRGRDYVFETATADQKMAAFDALRNLLAHLDAAGHDALIHALLACYPVDLRSLTDHSALTWDMIEEMDASGLVEFGAHTVRHLGLSAQDVATARAEMELGRTRLAERVRQPVVHFAYPFGGRLEAADREFRLAEELNFATAVTTRMGNIMAGHRDHLHCLPRLSVGGRLASLPGLRMMLRGLIPAFVNGFRPMVTA
ncbi:MAG TPA: polysaccharide deacetylase family protein [Microvirga sp.]|nr:polysaccharide deacetylase family protein [Microvirga sp.]